MNTAWVGAGVWDAAVIMARYMSSVTFDAKDALELGSGTGLTGLAVSLKIRVVMTDYL